MAEARERVGSAVAVRAEATRAAEGTEARETAATAATTEAWGRAGPMAGACPDGGGVPDGRAAGRLTSAALGDGGEPLDCVPPPPHAAVRCEHRCAGRDGGAHCSSFSRSLAATRREELGHTYSRMRCSSKAQGRSHACAQAVEGARSARAGAPTRCARAQLTRPHSAGRAKARGSLRVPTAPTSEAQGCGGQPEERATSESRARRAGEVAAQPFETTRISQPVSEGECRRPKWAPAGPATQGRGDSRAGGAVRQDRSSASPGSRRHPLSTDGATEAAQSGAGRLGVGGTGGTPRQSFRGYRAETSHLFYDVWGDGSER